MSDTRTSNTANFDAPPSGTSFQPAGAIGDAGVEFSGEGGSNGGGSKLDTAKQAVRDNASKLTGQAGDKAREYAEQGKTRAVEGLGQLQRTIEDAAQQVEEKLGGQYAEYVRSAAGQVSTLSQRIEGADVDELVDGVRDFVRRSPGAAIGAAALVGFVLARVVQAGIDDSRG